MYSRSQLIREMLVIRHKLMFLNTEILNLYYEMKLLSQANLFLLEIIFHNHIFEMSKHQYLQLLTMQSKISIVSYPMISFFMFNFQRLNFSNTLSCFLKKLFSFCYIHMCTVKVCTHITSILIVFCCYHFLESFPSRLIWEVLI